MLTEIFALIVSYLGVFIGFWLSKIAKSEVKHGEKNLFYLQSLLAILIVVWTAYSLDYESLSNFITASYGLFTLIFLLVVILFSGHNYALFGILFGLRPDFVTGSLILLYGFPAGSLMHRDGYKKIFMKTSPYILLGVISILIREYLFI